MERRPECGVVGGTGEGDLLDGGVEIVLVDHGPEARGGAVDLSVLVLEPCADAGFAEFRGAMVGDQGRGFVECLAGAGGAEEGGDGGAEAGD